MRLSASSSRLTMAALVAALVAICAEAATNDSCGCTPASPMAMFGPSRGRRSVPPSSELPPSGTSTDSDTIRIDDMLIPRSEFERAASPGTGRFSAPSDYINCVRPWPNGVLRYRFSSTYPNSSRILIRQSLATLQSRTGNLVTFVEGESFASQAHVTIIDEDGCWSYVGKMYSYSSQELSLSVPSCMLESIIQHEFIHALGFYHEQSRYDRDSYVNILWSNIESYTCTNFNKNSYLIPSSFPSYDYDSVMHYSSSAFACYPDVSTVVMKNGSIIDMRTNLTDLDVAKLRFVYSSNNLEYCLPATATSATTMTAMTTTREKSPSAGSVTKGSWLGPVLCALVIFCAL